MSSATSLIESSRQSEHVTLKSLQSSEAMSVWYVVAAFLLLSVPLAYLLNIWQDEAYSLHSTSGGILEAFRQSIGFEAQAPLYFVVLAAWRDINSSAFFARLLSIVLSLVTLGATWSFARRYVRTVRPYIAVAVVAFNPFTIWAAVEIRPYAASIAASAVLLLLFFRGYLDEKPNPAARIAYICVAIFGTYTLYYVAFLLPAHFVALVVVGRRDSARRFCLDAIAFALALVPIVIIVPEQLKSYHAFALLFKIPSYTMITVLFGYPFPHGFLGSWVHRPIFNAIYFVAALVPIVLAIRYLRPISVVTKALLAIVVALLAIYTGVIVIAHVHVLVPRHTLVMLVPMLLCAVAVIGEVAPYKRRIALFSYLMIYGVFAISSLTSEFSGLTKIGDWRRVANFVAANARSGDGVALFNAEAELPFNFYFKRRIPILPIPHPMSFDRFDEESFVLHNVDEVAASFGKFSARHDRVWLVETEACTPEYAFFGCTNLDKFVSEHFTVKRTTRFKGTTVLELLRRTPNAAG